MENKKNYERKTNFGYTQEIQKHKTNAITGSTVTQIIHKLTHTKSTQPPTQNTVTLGRIVRSKVPSKKKNVDFLRKNKNIQKGPIIDFLPHQSIRLFACDPLIYRNNETKKNNQKIITQKAYGKKSNHDLTTHTIEFSVYNFSPNP